MRKISIMLVVVLLLQFVPSIAVAENDYTPQAEALKQLGLFLGTDSGFELDRAATRAEAAVMTVRLLGKEADAKNGDFAHPFTDVPAWAGPYVGYLFHNKITTGISDTQFGSSQTATSAQYATFVLRALGYDDSAGDFTWDKSLDKMVSLGIITGGEAATFESGRLRGYIAAISHLSLFAGLKGSSLTLLDKLYLSDKAITPAQMKAAAAIDGRLSMASNVYGIPKPYPEGDTLDSEQVFKKASDAVFTIKTKVLTDSDFGSGSGFFITSDGLALTNYHVLSFMSSATITTADGKTYPIEGVLAINDDADLALIKVKGSGFPYLEAGDPAALRAAQRIYTIGSPLGFDNSISDGLVSNPNREHEGHTYIQISAPIARGSSGGALLNEYGQVVGVTTAGFMLGSVNLAVRITDLADAFRYPQVRPIRYFEAHSHFGVIPATDLTYIRDDSAGAQPKQTMRNDTLMLGTIRSAFDVHSYLLDVEDPSEIFVSLTTSAAHSAGLRFEVTDPSGKVVLTSRHYSGEIFSIAAGLGAVKGLYKVRIFVNNNGEDWANVPYELFWLCFPTFEVSDYSRILFEFEPNDTREHANYLPDFYDVLATISDRNDVDYYSFTLTSRSEYNAIIITDQPRSVLSAEVFDSENKSVGRFSFDGMAETFKATLTAGTYYIRVSAKDAGIQWNNEHYVISGWYMP